MGQNGRILKSPEPENGSIYMDLHVLIAPAPSSPRHWCSSSLLVCCGTLCTSYQLIKSVSGLYLLMWKSTKITALMFFLSVLHFDSIIDALFFAPGHPCNQQHISEQHKDEGCANLNGFSHSQLIHIICMYQADMFPPSQTAAERKTGRDLHKLTVLSEHVQSHRVPSLPAGSQPSTLPYAYTGTDSCIRNRAAASM